MKKIILLLLIMLPVAFANTNICEQILSENNVKEGLKVPKSIPFGNEVMNFYGPDETPAGHVVIAKHSVTSLNCSLADKPDYNVFINDENITQKILNSNNTIKEIKDSIGNEIIIKGQSLTKSIKLGIVKVGIKIMSLLGLA
ncbi:MAG: hypothetical protein ACQESF_06760 [Nanobdellota archaeon]